MNLCSQTVQSALYRNCVKCGSGVWCPPSRSLTSMAVAASTEWKKGPSGNCCLWTVSTANCCPSPLLPNSLMESPTSTGQEYDTGGPEGGVGMSLNREIYLTNRLLSPQSGQHSHHRLHHLRLQL